VHAIAVIMLPLAPPDYLQEVVAQAIERLLHATLHFTNWLPAALAAGRSVVLA
jgi:hypothetical protein